MEKVTTLIRLNAQADDLLQPDQWHNGLRLHLQYAGLNAITVKINAEQRCYLASSGCAGCTVAQCVPGCRTVLLRRLIKACFADQVQTTVIPRGLAAQKYTHFAIGWPKKGAVALTASGMEPWNHARLHVQWKASSTNPQANGLLCVSGGTASPTTFFAAHGWNTLSVSATIIHPFIKRQSITQLPISTASSTILSIPLPNDRREDDPQLTALSTLKDQHVSTTACLKAAACIRQGADTIG